VQWFDACARLGRTRARPHYEPEGTPENLLAAMDRFGITEALVYSAHGDETHPSVGNRLLLDITRANPRLHPCLTLLPPATGEFPPPSEHIPELIEQGVRAVRLTPSAHAYDLNEAICGELLIALQQHRVPLFIDVAAFPHWDTLDALAGQYPELPIVLTSFQYGMTRNAYSVLLRRANLYAELHGYELHDGLEDLLPRIGAHRLLFGTGWPEYTPASPMTMLASARIGRPEKIAIARENLTALLAGVSR
jgi:hypothetical protein